MQEKLRRIRDERAEGDHGFTLIELLVVVVIIGVLIAIAIPLYLNYRKGAENKSAASDLRGAISTLEQCYTDNSNVYPSAVTGAGAMTGCSTG
ncbi:MAG: prepilin-type N-terminal cleavage/methylation domain-containing protein, partial [Actinobacteria bacterium]|nr:prepilin-type N-terminal cleavage/methylation domain-containing protein [Actinomycetota bacterium]